MPKLKLSKQFDAFELREQAIRAHQANIALLRTRLHDPQRSMNTVVRGRAERTIANLEAQIEHLELIQRRTRITPRAAAPRT